MGRARVRAHLVKRVQVGVEVVAVVGVVRVALRPFRWRRRRT